MVKYTRIAGTLGKGTGKLFTGIFRFRILFIFLCFIFLNAAIMGIQANDFSVTLIELGNRFITPTLELQQTSLAIIENKGLYQQTPDIYGGMIKVLLDVILILSHFYIIVLWIAMLAFIVRNILIWDSSKGASSYLIGLIFFIATQMIILAFTTGSDMMTPIHAFRDFFRSLPFIVKPVADIADNLMGDKISIFNMTTTQNGS